MNKKLMNKKGFTLIELIVVIAIIGLLSTLAVVALGTAYAKARDSRRLSDLKQLSSALELYYSDVNSYPPVVPAGATSITLGSAEAACLNSTGFTTAGCSSPYMGQVPSDPKSPGVYSYSLEADGSYKVTATLEGTTSGLSGNIKLTPAGISVVTP